MSAMVHQQAMSDAGTYTFASQPRALNQRKKYRDLPNVSETPSHPVYGNIMYDRRVIRGSTYAQRTLPASAQPDPLEVQRQQEVKRRRRAANQQVRVRTPEPVEGRRHTDVQTELYLEELSERIEEADVECQTDAFLDRPKSPMFIAAKSGVDCATQILDGELFDFNVEVRPVLQVLVGKTVEQALIEVMEEEELANLREQQRIFHELRTAELVEQQRLEEEDRRRRLEKERRMEQQQEALKVEEETKEKIAARSFAQSYLADLVPSVFGLLQENRYFYDPIERGVENMFIPWLLDQCTEQLDRNQLSRQILDEIIRDAVRTKNELFVQLEETEAESEEMKEGDDEVGDADDESNKKDSSPVNAGDEEPVTAGDDVPVTAGDEEPVNAGDEEPATTGDDEPVTAGDDVVTKNDEEE
jgi:hypothetical protein